MLPPKTIVWGACMFVCYGPPRQVFDAGKVHLWYGENYAGFNYVGG